MLCNTKLAIVEREKTAIICSFPHFGPFGHCEKSIRILKKQLKYWILRKKEEKYCENKKKYCFPLSFFQFLSCSVLHYTPDWPGTGPWHTSLHNIELHSIAVHCSAPNWNLLHCTALCFTGLTQQAGHYCYTCGGHCLWHYLAQICTSSMSALSSSVIVLQCNSITV